MTNEPIEKTTMPAESLIRLLNNLPGLAYRTLNNRNWTMQFASRGCYELTGYRPNELIDDRVVSYNDLIHPDYRGIVWDEAQKALHDRVPLRYTYPIVTRQGVEKWVYEHGVGLYADGGEAVALEGIIFDITAQLDTENRLNRENIFLKASLRNSYNFGNIVGRSKPIQEVFDLILKVAGSDANVIVTGESGTGKELAARAIHEMSRRRDRRFVAVNCSAIPQTLFESEFFGYKKGAFTGAMADKPGFLDLARGGSLFLDEVGDIDPAMQVKLLRAIDGGGYTPVGGGNVKTPDVRIIAATNRDLEQLVKRGRLREDFFFRIHVIRIHLPPLRERKEDIPLLVFHFWEKCSHDTPLSTIPQDVMRAIQNYDWPGNVRELENFIYRYAATRETAFVDLKPLKSPVNLPDAVADARVADLQPDLRGMLAAYEREILLKTLQRVNWHRGRAAAYLNLHYRTLLRKMKQHGISQAHIVA